MYAADCRRPENSLLSSLFRNSILFKSCYPHTLTIMVHHDPWWFFFCSKYGLNKPYSGLALPLSSFITILLHLSKIKINWCQNWCQNGVKTGSKWHQKSDYYYLGFYTIVGIRFSHPLLKRNRETPINKAFPGFFVLAKNISHPTSHLLSPGKE